MRLALRAAAALFVVLAAVPALGLFGTSAGSSPISASGYWVKLGLALPIVPSGGMLVGDDPTEAVNPAQPPNLPIPLPVAIPAIHLPGPQLFGFTAVSALRIVGISPTADVTLTLKTSLLSIPPLPLVSTIVACPIPGPWSPPARPGGEISTAPPSNCLNPSVGRVSPDLGAVSWDLPSSFQGTPGELDVELEPGTTGLPVPFLLTFDAPGPDAVAASAGGPPPLQPKAPPPTPVASYTPPAGAAGAPVLLAPVATGPSTPSSPAAPPANLAAPSGAAPRLAVVSLGGHDDRAHRIMAVVVLLALGAGWFWLGGLFTRAPRRLGALGGDTGSARDHVGGIGRFRRVRTDRPPRL